MSFFINRRLIKDKLGFLVRGTGVSSMYRLYPGKVK